MSKLSLNIGIIGCGNMGAAIIGALTQSAIADPGRIQVADINQDRLNEIRDTYRVTSAANSADLFARSNVVILAVKPQQMAKVLHEIAIGINIPTLERKIVVSIAAGVPMRTIERILYGKLEEASMEKLPIIRAMPNTPALVLHGMSGMSSNRFANDGDREVARIILSAMGKVIEFREEDLDAVTAVSGSGPAYVFYLAESMVEAGIALGLTGDDASALTLGTLKGAAALLEREKNSPEKLRENVTSPGGTTAAAFKVLEARRVKRTIVEAIIAARDRGRELSQIA